MTGRAGRSPKAPGGIAGAMLAAVRKLAEQEMPRIGRGSVVATGAEQGRDNPLRYTRPGAAGWRRRSRAPCKSSAIIHLVSSLTIRASARVAVLRDHRPGVHTVLCGCLLERVESLLDQRVALYGICSLLEDLFLSLLERIGQSNKLSRVPAGIGCRGALLCCKATAILVQASAIIAGPRRDILVYYAALLLADIA